MTILDDFFGPFGNENECDVCGEYAAHGMGSYDVIEGRYSYYLCDKHLLPAQEPYQPIPDSFDEEDGMP